MTDPGEVHATVAVLTFNSEEFLDEVLEACSTQDAPFGYEVLVVDSGSTDRTLEIVARHPEVRLHQIPNREFGHGRTRNLAAHLAAGEIVVFLTHDATPVGSNWLAALLASFDDDPALAAVYARQVPRPGCRPAAAREVIEVFRNPPPGFFSNVCSAVPRTVLDRIPFREVDYAEDRAFASDAAAEGLRITCASVAEVWHSHDLPFGSYFRRMYDEARGLRKAKVNVPGAGVLRLAAATIRGTLKDWLFIIGHDAYTVPEKLRWATTAPAYNVARRLAIWLAARRRLPVRVAAFLSLDHRRRLAARP